MMEWLRTSVQRLRKAYRNKSIQLMLSLNFTVAAIVCMVAMGVLLYMQFTAQLQGTFIGENQQLVNQIALNVNNYTRNMRRVSDSMYYSVIKNVDLEAESLDSQLNLLYEANKDYLLSIAVFTEEGEMLAATPLASVKPGVDVTKQDWFTRAVDVIENTHFSNPHVQNLFENDGYQYNWAISMSRMVELVSGGGTSRGVLLVDMRYTGIEEIFTQMTAAGSGYVYLIDSAGEIIYHPSQRLIYSDLMRENNLAAAGYTDGLYEEVFEGATRQVIVKTVSYTGWRVVSVIPNTEFSITFAQMRLVVMAAVGLAILLIILVNSFVSSRVSSPIKKLERSVKELDQGKLDLDIYIGGPYEIEHLGKTIRHTVEQMRSLLDDIVYEQEQKRKHEFGALQAQINPHFLYNTLDSIVWMIEDGRQQEAISMVTALANLFRISLSRGSAIISVETELQHAQYYLHIQNIRYRNKFNVTWEVDEDVKACTTIKLVVQPILENAIYHAMELMDGDGEIHIRAWAEEADVYIEVRDNGLGMSDEMCQALLTGRVKSTRGSKGSGTGVRNVHQRIQLYYGEQYGLRLHSEQDVGTTVCIHLPRRYGDEEPPAKESGKA